MKQRRERLEIVKDILEVVKRKYPIKPTRLMSVSNLSPKMFKEYIKELINKNFIKIVFDEKLKKGYLITDKGIRFLKEYSIIENILDKYEIKEFVIRK